MLRAYGSALFPGVRTAFEPVRACGGDAADGKGGERAYEAQLAKRPGKGPHRRLASGCGVGDARLYGERREPRRPRKRHEKGRAHSESSAERAGDQTVCKAAQGRERHGEPQCPHADAGIAAEAQREGRPSPRTGSRCPRPCPARRAPPNPAPVPPCPLPQGCRGTAPWQRVRRPVPAPAAASVFAASAVLREGTPRRLAQPPPPRSASMESPHAMPANRGAPAPRSWEERVGPQQGVPRGEREVRARKAAEGARKRAVQNQKGRARNGASPRISGPRPGPCALSCRLPSCEPACARACECCEQCGGNGQAGARLPPERAERGRPPQAARRRAPRPRAARRRAGRLAGGNRYHRPLLHSAMPHPSCTRAGSAMPASVPAWWQAQVPQAPSMRWRA